MVIPSEYVSSICEIKTMDNNLVATGMVSVISDEYMEISIKSCIRSIIRYGSEVKINIFNSKYGFRVLVGNVYTSSSEFVRLIDITSILDYERRHFFRVDLDMKADVCIHKHQKEFASDTDGLKDEEKKESMTISSRRHLGKEFSGFYQQKSSDSKKQREVPIISGSHKFPLKRDIYGRDPIDYYDIIPVRVRNISLSGMLISTDLMFQNGKMLVLLQLDTFKGILECSIKRVEEGQGQAFLYGCEFVDLSDDISDSLCRFVFQKQREQINVTPKAKNRLFV